MNAADYQSFADAWESRATIRTRPRRVLENDDKLIYPLEPPAAGAERNLPARMPRNSAISPWCRRSTNSSTTW